MVRTTRPIQSVLMVVFFLSIGLLIDLGFIWENLGTVILLLVTVTVVKTAVNVGILRLLREPWPTLWSPASCSPRSASFRSSSARWRRNAPSSRANPGS